MANSHARTAGPGCDEPTSRCQKSCRRYELLGRYQPVIPGYRASGGGGKALPYRTTGSPKTYFRTCSGVSVSRSNALLPLYSTMTDFPTGLGAPSLLLRYSLEETASQTTHHTLSSIRITDLGSEPQSARVMVFRMAPRTGVHASKPPTYPAQKQIQSQCRKCLVKFRVFPSNMDTLHLLAISISPGSRWRQRRHHVTPFIEFGTYPDEEFRYLRTVIVAAPVYQG